MKGFKKFGGEELLNLGAYVREYVRKHKNVEVHVGCDSEMRGATVAEYVTVVAIYHVNNGAHYVFLREHQKGIRSILDKLWGEVERVLAVGEYLERELLGNYGRASAAELRAGGYDPTQNKLVTLHVDLNPLPGTEKRKKRGRNKGAKVFHENKSNVAHAAAMGYLVGSGFRVKCKPHAWAASCAADYIVKPRRRRHRKARREDI